MCIYEVTILTADGQPKYLAEFRCKIMLITNTVSKCGFTPPSTRR